MNKTDYIQMDTQEIRRRLVPLGYNIIDGNYQSKGSKRLISLGLILQEGDDESVLADIREFEGQIVVPYKGKTVPKGLSKLVKDLSRAGIPFRPFAGKE